jgi:drug/metabolite transporter (DMT)-like permease
MRLLLNAESLFTVAIAFVFLNERCAKREYIGILMLLVGVIFLTSNGVFEKLSLSENIFGNLLVIGACFFWGIDNNLSKFLSRKRDIIMVTGLKCFVGGLGLLGISFLLGFSFTIPLISIPYILFVGAFSIMFSILFFLFALRKIGSMRTGVIFSLSSFRCGSCLCCLARIIYLGSVNSRGCNDSRNIRSLSLWKKKIASKYCEKHFLSIF